MSKFMKLPSSIETITSSSWSNYDNMSYSEVEKKRKHYFTRSQGVKEDNENNSESNTTTVSSVEEISGSSPATSPSSKQQHIKRKRQLILEYSIDPYEYSNEELIEMAQEIFSYYSLPSLFHFTSLQLTAFLNSVASLYHANNNFHNFKHAWGVMHMSFQLLIHGCDKCLTSFDILAVLVSAICHDIGHPGNNNAFEFAIQSDVSKKYQKPNENCVLERYHIGLTQSLLFPSLIATTASSTPSSPDTETSKKASTKKGKKNSKSDHEECIDNDILNGLNENDKKSFMDTINYIILGTDMAKHGALVEETQSYVKQIKELTALVNNAAQNTTVMNNHPSCSSSDSEGTRALLIPSSSSSTATTTTSSELTVPEAAVTKEKELLSIVPEHEKDEHEDEKEEDEENNTDVEGKNEDIKTIKEGKLSSKLSLNLNYHHHGSPKAVDKAPSSSTHRTSPLSPNHQEQSTTHLPSSFDEVFSSKEARLALIRILVHTADIGAQTQDYSIAYKWCGRCYGEFQTQAQKEKELGIMTSPFMHDLTDDSKIFTSQYSFITDIVEPIWKAFTELFPNLQFASNQLINNKVYYQKHLNSIKQQLQQQQQQQKQQQADNNNHETSS
jgi:hypothetical protein